MALVPLWTWAPCAGDPVASISTHIRPFSPKRTTRGEPTSPQMLASPRACGTFSSSQPDPSDPMFSSSPASVSTISPAQASRCSASSMAASSEQAMPPFMSQTPRP